MRKLLVVLAVILLIVGCAKTSVVDNNPPAKAVPAAVPPAAPVVPVESAPAEKGVAETVVVPAAPEVTVPKENLAPKNTPDVQVILQHAEDKVTSYQFYLAPPPDNLARDMYKVKNDKVKVELYNVDFYNPEEYFDTLYLDYSKKTAWAYCLRKDNIQCSGVRTGKEVPFDKYAIKLPLTYLGEVQGAKKIGSETLYDRQTVKLSYDVNGEPYTIWVDQYSGLPVRVVTGDVRSGPKWEFRELSINGLFDEDVTRPAN